jgi:adenylate cyclase class 2
MGRGNGVETELKYLGPDVEALRARLRELGAVLESPRSLEVNRVFDDEAGTLRRSARLLRLRDSRELTLKLPADPGSLFKSRVETTVVIESGDVEVLLAGLGYSVVWRYEKYREGWSLDGMYITIDEVPFIGAVVEIEGEPEGIEPTAARLGLDGLESSTETYSALFQRWARDHRMEPGDLTFEAEAVAS